MRQPRPLQAALRRAVAATATMLAGLLAAAPAVAQPDGWSPCAQEGAVCNVAGQTMVRFGADGRYAFRYAREPLPCTVAAFGSDPAPGLAKTCEVAPNWSGMQRARGWRDAFAEAGATQSWRPCAREGAVCALGATAQAVRFGADGRYVTRQLRGNVRCDSMTFGDPAPGMPKTCEVAGDSEWVLCANEGDTCRVPAPTRVRYGAEGRYVERQASQSVACHNGTFGDPAPGMPKQCEYRRAGGAGTPGVVDARLPWAACAREGERCRFTGGAMLRYGAPGGYVYLEAVGGVACGNEAFGSDPAPGQAKRCEVLRLR